MSDCLPPDMPELPENAIVYMVNSEVTKVVPVEQVPEINRGFNVPFRDAEGNFTLKYVQTAIIKTKYIDKEGKEVPIEKAVTVVDRYCDKDGNVIHRPLTMLIREKK